jgi:hypothetical protein
MTPQATNRKEGGAPGVEEALTSHLQKELENPESPPSNSSVCFYFLNEKPLTTTFV